MRELSRRSFFKTGAAAAASMALPFTAAGLNSVFAQTNHELIFRPYPHPWMPEFTYAYAADENEDPFKSSISVNRQGVVVPTDFGDRRFSVNARWFVEGFGYIWLSADNGGEYYSLKDFKNGNPLNLNYEFAKSRIFRNREVKERYNKNGVIFSSEVEHLFDLSEELFKEASKVTNSGEKCAGLSDKALFYALNTGEKIELEKAAFDIIRYNRRDNVYFGCETRQYIWARSEEFTKRFVELFNFATVTHYVWDTWYEIFEPREGYYNWGIKDNIVNWLTEHNITIQGRPLFWFHPVVTPDWLKEKNFDELKKYVDRHVKDVVGHYGDKVLQWEVVNEYHDWANIHNHSPEQITEIVRQACDRTAEINPKVVRIINNCSPFSEYAACGRSARQKEPSKRPLRSTRKFIEDLEQAGVDYDVLGIQVYFPRRDLSDIVRMLERFEKFNKPIYITEIGATSGPTKKSLDDDKMNISQEPYEWHRRWDEKLQADWLEQVYTLYYSRPNIKAINWYDFADFRTFIVNGGLVTENCTPKRSFYRLKNLLASWNRLPKS
ncbi:endo-1,4-beta-xylanase [candidate division KSB1 bacterium]|nr:endo-1,4-beta-xylanase [candidate division KSB1 bacterium]